MTIARTQNTREMGGEVDRVLHGMPAQAKGDLIVGLQLGQYGLLSVGADGKVLKANSAAAKGLEWGDAGVDEFINLTDVPASYTSQSQKVAVVKATEDGLEFVALSELIIVPPLFITPFVPPVLTEFSWVNQGTSTAEQTTRGIYIAPQIANNQQRILKKSKTGDYTVTMRFIDNSVTDSLGWTGFVWRESLSGKIVVFGFDPSTAQVFVGKFDSAEDGTSTDYYPRKSCNSMQGIRSLRVQVIGGARKCFISIDDEHWQELHSVSATDFITADELGMVLYQIDTGDKFGAHIIHWKEE